MGKGRNPKYKKLSRGYRKYLRREKARMRREISDLGEREKKIKELVIRFRPSDQPDNTNYE